MKLYDRVVVTPSLIRYETDYSGEVRVVKVFLGGHTSRIISFFEGPNGQTPTALSRDEIEWFFHDALDHFKRNERN